MIRFSLARTLLLIERYVAGNLQSSLKEGESCCSIPVTLYPYPLLSEQAPGGGDSNLDCPSVAQSDFFLDSTTQKDYSISSVSEQVCG